MKTQTLGFNEFMDGTYKIKGKLRKQKIVKKSVSVASSITIPIALTGGIGAIGLVMTGVKALATTNTSAIMPVASAVPVGAKEWMGEQTLSALAHVLDPVVDILVALSFPIASVVIVGACFMFMFGNSEKGWSMIQNAGLGYVLIQVSPLILNVLKQVGNAV
ncbi:hypothetical protein B4102_2279 [Heyndrickxia sporothermodurans]|uniref:Uncharacterized protein n=1 Tax=Heyndrickxia sporothermodurans TaxID=46224 RepID=A0A150LFS2_9BACI|nr:hypothetical protein [Heyndrickxia sporothermodurans]KYD11095.1 hypothetical protein B4102_2279 [Heyndrickxia sporothermodurans]